MEPKIGRILSNFGV